MAEHLGRSDRQAARWGVVFSPVARRGQRPAVSDRWERSGVHHRRLTTSLPIWRWSFKFTCQRSSRTSLRADLDTRCFHLGRRASYMTLRRPFSQNCVLLWPVCQFVFLEGQNYVQFSAVRFFLLPNLETRTLNISARAEILVRLRRPWKTKIPPILRTV